MADTDNLKDTKEYFLDIPMKAVPSNVRGANALDWGMQNRLSRIFHSGLGKTVMLAVDHGYFQGPTAGLERVDLTIVPLLQHANALMCTRGVLRSTIPSSLQSGVVLRASGGPSILKELSNEHIAVDMDDDRRTTATATTSACVRRPIVMRSRATDGGECVQMPAKKGQIGPSTTVWAARGDGSCPNCASALQEGGKTASIHGSPGVIWRIPAKSVVRHVPAREPTRLRNKTGIDLSQ
jgi:hypothetical protein